MYNPFADYISKYGMSKPDAYTPYAAGPKMYGAGQLNPTSGPVDKNGYQQRDREAAVKRQALLNQMKAAQSKNYLSTSYLGRQ